MPATKWRFDISLIRRLEREPYRFEFFQAVRLLLAYRRRHSCDPGLDVLGQVIRFRGSISLEFPPSEIESLEVEWLEIEDVKENQRKNQDKDGESMPFKSVTLTPSFIGLTGPSGVLPRHYTQHVAERAQLYRDSATGAFLDIFTSRAVALFYQSWLKYRLHFQTETDQKHHFLSLLLSLSGLSLTGMRGRLADAGNGIADESLAYYAAVLRSRPRSIDSFSAVVSDYFQVCCRIEQFIGQWFDLPGHQRTHLGLSHCLLGESSFCGGRVWERQSKVRLTIGPLRQTQFNDFLPNGAAFHNLVRLFRLIIGVTFDCEVQLILDKHDVVRICLDSRCGNAHLGWNTLCSSKEIRSDSHDTKYLIKASGHIN